MLRYLTLAWNERDRQECDAAFLIRQRLTRAAPWLAVLDTSGLLVSYIHRSDQTDTVVTLDPEVGAIVGTIFTRPNAAHADEMHRVDRLTAAQAKRLLQSNGRDFIADYWGSYVAFLRNAQRLSTHVIRSPMASLPCFRATFRGVQLFFSLVDDLLSLALVPLSINWESIRAQSVQGDYLTHATGLREISTLECGECFTLHGGSTVYEMYWDPRKLHRRGEFLDGRKAAAVLHATTQCCVSAWASLHNAILHRLSGGLDSSVVLGCLCRASSKPRVTAVNFFYRGAADERQYARSMARKTGTPIIERERNRRVDLRMFLSCARTASPVLDFSACDTEPVTLELSRQLGATAIFDGELGDNLFGRGVREEVVAEYAARYGLSSGLVSVALHYAMLKNITVWRALYHGVRDGVIRPRARSWSVHDYAMRATRRNPNEARLASAEALAVYRGKQRQFIHPWMRDVEDLPVGKLLLLYGLIVVTSTSYHSPFSPADAPPRVAPLASQPLVEIAMRIPTHLHIENGVDRAVARCAFAADLSPEVLERGISKGTPEPWARDLAESGRDFLREMLLDGMLVKQGILDRKKIETILSPGINKVTPHLAEVFVQLYIEAWLRRWQDSRMPAAA